MPFKYAAQPKAAAKPEQESAIGKGIRLYNTPIINMVPGGKEAMDKLAQPGLSDVPTDDNILEKASKKVLGKTITSFLPTTKAKLKGFASGGSQGVTPALVAQAASLGTGTPAALANAAIAAQGGYDALDSSKSTIDRMLGGVNLIGGLAGASSGLRIRKAGQLEAPKTTSYEIEPTIRPGENNTFGGGTIKPGSKGKVTLTGAKKMSGHSIDNITGDAVGTPREMPNLVKPASAKTGPITPAELEQDIQRVNSNPVMTNTPIVGTPAEASGRVQKIVAKEQKAAAKTALDVEKSQEAANKLVGKEKADAAKAQTKFVEGEAAQTSRNLNAKGKFTRSVEVAQANAETEAGKRAAAAQKHVDNENNLAAIERAKEDRVATEPSISESVSAKTGEGQRTSMSRRFVKPEPPADGEGVDLGVSLTGDVQDVDRDVLKHHTFGNKDDAKDAAIKYGAKDVKKAGRGKYHLVFDDAPAASALTPKEARAASLKALEDKLAGEGGSKGTPGQPHPDTEPPMPFEAQRADTLRKIAKMRGDVPETPVTPPIPAVKAEMAPSLEKDFIKAQRYKNKVEAGAIAKATGGTVHQDGPRAYSIRFSDYEHVPLEADPITPSPTIELPKPKTEPKNYGNFAISEPAAEKTYGDLSPQEYNRYLDVSPRMGGRQTPAELAEYLALHERLNKPVAEVSDYTGGQPTHGLEVPVPDALPEVTPESIAAAKAASAAERLAAEKTLPGKMITPEGKIQSADVIDVGKTPLATASKTMQDMADVANKPGPQLGKVDFPTSKLPGKSQLPDEIQASLLETPKEEVPLPPGALTDAVKQSEGGAIPARLFKSRLDAAGENYGAIKEAKLAGEKVPEEGRAIAGKAAAAEKRAAGVIPAAKVPEKGPAADLGPTYDDLAKMSKKEQEKQLTDLVQKFKNNPKGGSTLSAFGGGQMENALKIAVENPAFTRALTTVVGAGVGAETSDDPLTGAVVGGGIGFGAPSVAKLINAARTGNINKQNAESVVSHFKDVLDTAMRMMPDFQRAALLSKPLPLIINSVVGPWGSIVMHGLEDAAILDPRGIKLLKLALNPKNFPREYMHSLPKAHELIGSAAERTEGLMGQQGPNWYRTMTQYPGVAMTAGDEAARDMAKAAGYTEEEARVMTLTSEPYTSGGAGLSKLKKGSINRDTEKRGWLFDMALPFYRTSTNQVEQGLERMPFVGIWMNKYAKSKPAAWQQQVAQQMIGGSTGYVGYLLGEETPPEDARNVLKFINNFGGQYGALASAGFMMGQASARGSSDWKALTNEVASALPMPSTQPVNDAMQNVGALFGEGDFKMPSGFVPGILDPEDPLTGLLVGAVAPKSAGADKPVTSNRFKYVPQKR